MRDLREGAFPQTSLINRRLIPAARSTVFSDPQIQQADASADDNTAKLASSRAYTLSLRPQIVYASESDMIAKPDPGTFQVLRVSSDSGLLTDTLTTGVPGCGFLVGLA